MFAFMTIAKALADANRVRILCVLRAQELCVCQIIEMLGLAPSTVSKHLSILRQARLLEDRKEGRWMYYRHPDRPNALVKQVLALLATTLPDDEQMQSDRECVKKILCVDKEELCRTQKKVDSISA
jgi:DNA-binding transcriptional ArsR family regulator